MVIIDMIIIEKERRGIMSKEIPTAGKVWLIIICIIAALGIVGNFASAGEGIEYIISAIACVGEVVAIIFLLKGKGLPFLGLYAGCYLINSIMSLIASSDKTTAYIIGFVFGIAINFALTYLSVKKTIKLNK